MADLFQFRWAVDNAGYTVLEIPEHGQHVTSARRSGQPENWRQYFPLTENTGLFHTFAETPDDESGVISFANRYGLLRSTNMAEALRDPQGKPAGWLYEIRRMRTAVELLYSAVPHKVADRFQWLDRADLPAIVYRCDDFAHTVLGAAAGKVKKDDVRTAMGLFIDDLINGRLQGNVSFQLLRESGQSRLFAAPRHLLGAMWLQFAQAVSNQSAFKRCVECGAWFEQGSGRADKKYCSDRCKTAFNRRQRNAKT